MLTSWLSASVHPGLLGAENTQPVFNCVSAFPCDFIFRGFHGQLTSSLLCLKGWEKGVVFINGQNLGRYWNIGPQETLYLPGTWLDQGINQVRALAALPFPQDPLLLPALTGITGFPWSQSVKAGRAGGGQRWCPAPLCSSLC